MLKKVVLLIFDGLADRPIKELGGKTPLEAAHTPNLDALARRSQCGMMHSLGRGVRPGSDVSHLAIFGYPMQQYYTGRGPIEVAGLGVTLQEGDIALRGNFGTADAAMGILDRRAGRIREVGMFAEALNGTVIDGVEFLVAPGTAHRAGVVMRGKGLSAAISDADPHEENKPMYTVMPTDNTSQAAFTASVLNKFIKKSFEILDAHPENKKRVAEGKLPANIVLLRGAGIYPTLPKIHEKYGLGRGCCIAGGGLYKGIGAFLGLEIIDVEGANALPDSDLAAKFRAASNAQKDYDFIFIHVKAADSLGEDGDFVGKKEFLEKADKALSSLSLSPDTLLVVTADHTTPCTLKAHSADAVPIMFCGEGVRVDGTTEFNESMTARGSLGIMEGKDVMPHIMNLLGKLPLIGA